MITYALASLVSAAKFLVFLYGFLKMKVAGSRSQI